MITEPEVTFNEDTLFKVATSLREADLSETQIDAAIHSMQNFGILFRERVDPDTHHPLF
jgi:hypothetical protein